MANFSEHINQAKKNLQFLSEINKNTNDSWDWQVTVCFYVAVHLVNAHIAQKANQHYRSHEQVKEALNPYNALSLSKLTEGNFLAFDKLQNLSRRSRYLCNDTIADKDIKAFFTYDKHLSKSLKNLDKILGFIVSEYKESFLPIELYCIELKGQTLNFFAYKAIVA